MRDVIYIKFKYRQNSTVGFRDAYLGSRTVKKSKAGYPL